jgi:hypothetical protein
MHVQKDASSVYDMHDGTGGPPSPRTPDELPLPDEPLDEPPEDVPEEPPDDPPLDVPPDDVPPDDVPPDDVPPDEPLPDEPLDDSGCTAPAHAQTHVQNSTAATAPRHTPGLFARRLMARTPR